MPNSVVVLKSCWRATSALALAQQRNTIHLSFFTANLAVRLMCSHQAFSFKSTASDSSRPEGTCCVLPPTQIFALWANAAHRSLVRRARPVTLLHVCFNMFPKWNFIFNHAAIYTATGRNLQRKWYVIPIAINIKQQISPKENAENRNNRKKSWLIHRLSYTEELAVGSETLQTELRYQAVSHARLSTL